MKRRVFISINLDDSTKRYIANKIQPLKQKLPARWANPSLYHLTISFLGHLEDNIIADICGTLKDNFENFPAFDVSLNSLVWNPSLNRAKMLWLSGEPNIHLAEMRRLADDAAHGVPVHARQFRPHITLAKIKRAKVTGRMLSMLEIEKVSVSVSVEALSVDVMESKQEEGKWNHYLMESIELS